MVLTSPRLGGAGAGTGDRRTVAPAAGRFAAVLALVSVAIHALSLVQHGTAHGVWMAILMGAMTAGCVICAWHLWHNPGRREWLISAAMYAVMAGLHLPLVVTGSVNHTNHSDHGGHGEAAEAGHGAPHAEASAAALMEVDLGMLSLTALSVIQVTVALVVLRRHSLLAKAGPTGERPRADMAGKHD